MIPFDLQLYIHSLDGFFYITNPVSSRMGSPYKKSRNKTTALSQHTRKHLLKQVVQRPWSFCKLQACDPTIDECWLSTVLRSCCRLTVAALVGTLELTPSLSNNTRAYHRSYCSRSPLFALYSRKSPSHLFMTSSSLFPFFISCQNWMIKTKMQKKKKNRKMFPKAPLRQCKRLRT